MSSESKFQRHGTGIGKTVFGYAAGEKRAYAILCGITFKGRMGFAFGITKACFTRAE